MQARTAGHQLADVHLGDKGPLETFVALRRGQGLSWRSVARDLYIATDHRTNVTGETLRAWFPQFAKLHAVTEATT